MTRRIPIDMIDPNPDQPRTNFPEEHIARLAASIKKRGLIQPITLRPKGTRFEIVAGECRYRAFCLLIQWGHSDFHVIDCNIVDIDKDEMQLRAIVENLQRKDMNPIEEAKAFKTLIDSGFTVQRVVDELGLKSQAIVRQRLDLMDLSVEIQHLVSTGQLAVNMAWGVAQAPLNYQSRLIRDIASGRLRTSEQVKHAGIALRDAAAQQDAFGEAPVISKTDIAAISRLESKIDTVASMIQSGFKDGECVAAQRVSPDRVKTLADKLSLIRKHVLQMEHDLRRVAMQTEIKLECVA